ncbi:MAG: SGNH/GDSL hydrolase family protein [Kiloniellales bacterium]|nr:SGNH/GDSL hydrolase family protein [Kiloniellales bacterium]
MHKLKRWAFKGMVWTLALYFGGMLVVSVAGDMVSVAKLAMREGDKRQRHTLIVFDDKERAKKIFEDSRGTIEAYAPYVGWRRLPMQSETVNIGPDGLRMHDTGVGTGPNLRTVGVFGGSGVWGTGVDDSNTIPAILEQMSSGYKVKNFGEGGWTSRQSLAQLINLINQNEAPDIAIFYTGANDATLSCDLNHGSGYNSHKNATYYRRLVLDSETPRYLYRNFAVPAIETFKRVTGRKKAKKNFVCDQDRKRASKIAATMFKNWQIARTLMLAEGKEFYAFLRPMTGVGSLELDHLTLDPNALAQYLPVYEAVRTLIDEEGEGWAWDLSDSFDGGPPVFMDDGHIVGAGNRIVAERIRDIVMRR